MRLNRLYLFVISWLVLSLIIMPSLADQLVLPAGTKAIEAEAFYGTESLDEVVLPDAIDSIGKLAFACSSLKRINLPESLTFIEPDAFEGCRDLLVTAEEGTYGYQWAIDNNIDVNTECYVLDIYWVGNSDNEAVRAGVEEAVNAYVRPLINARVSFHIIGWGDWEYKAVNALQSGEKMDLIFTADWEGYGAEAFGGLLQPLDELLEQYGQGIIETLPQGYIDGAKVNGILYAVPTNKEFVIPQGFIINKTAANSIGWDVKPDDPSIRSTQDLEPWLAKYKQKYPNKYPYLMDGQTGRWVDEPWVPDWAGMAANSIAMKMAKDENGNFDETIYNIFATPEQQAHIRLMYDWAQKGYISPEAARDNFDYLGTFGRGDFLAFCEPLLGNGIRAAEMYAANALFEFECVEITMQPKYVVTANTAGSMFAIPVTCQNPAAAMKFLNLMHSDAALVNLMVFGAEGVNYTKVNDQQVIIQPDANWYSMHGGGWTVGNTALQYVLDGEDPEKNQMLQEFGRDAVATLSLGFRFVKDSVAGLVAAVDAAVNELAIPLMTGQADPDDTFSGINALLTAMNNAGIAQIMEEISTQFNAWLTAVTNAQAGS